MTAPLLYDLFCKAGGSSAGYMQAGFRVIGVDIEPQPNHCGDGFVQMDALAFIAAVLRGEYEQPAAWHASPPCQGYSVMRNLPWLREKEYPLLILPVRELLHATGAPYVIENVMGARYGSAGLKRRGLEAHGLQAGLLCGVMFGKRFYRHRLFEANWLWLAPPHPRHQVVLVGRSRAMKSQSLAVCPDAEADSQPAGVNNAGRFLGPRARLPIFSAAEDARGVQATTGRRGEAGHGLTSWQENGIPSGVGHTAGIAEVKREMECEWMTRDEVAQAVPPCYTKLIGTQLLAALD